MAIKFHKPGFDHAVHLIKTGQVTSFDSNWNEEKPTHTEMVNYINTHDMKEYGSWFLGVDDKFPKDTKEHYVYPHGDLKLVQKAALVNTLRNAEKNNEQEIVKATKTLIDMVDKKVAEMKK